MRIRRRRRIQTDQSASNNGQMMNLSLFIMLLAFFIVLNSISSYEEKKSEKVRQSVDQAFSKNIFQENDSPSITPDPIKSVNEGDVFERLEVLFEAQIVSFETKINRSTGVMMVTIPYDEFSKAMFALDQVDLTKNPTRIETRGNYLLPTLSSLIKTDINGSPTRMEIYFHTNENPARMQNEKPLELNEIIQDIGRFSRLLEGKGVPQKLLNIGISKGDADEVELVFRKHKAFAPVEVPKQPPVQEEGQ